MTTGMFDSLNDFVFLAGDPGEVSELEFESRAARVGETAKMKKIRRRTWPVSAPIDHMVSSLTLRLFFGKIC